MTRVPRDVWAALEGALQRSSGLPREVISTMLRAAYEASRSGRPLCQDTGIPTFFVELGDGFPLRALVIEKVTREVVARVTSEGLMRPNAVDPFRGCNTGNNLGRYFPVIHLVRSEEDVLRVTFLAKGGGSEYVSRLCMPPPSKGLEGVRECVIRAVLEAGPKPCPPVVIGVGIAASADVATLLSRKALALRKVGARHSEVEVARFEEALLNDVNKLGLGPMGLGGSVTALDIHVEYGCRHPASMAVAVAFSCWALRRATITLTPDGDVIKDEDDFWVPPPPRW